MFKIRIQDKELGHTELATSRLHDRMQKIYEVLCCTALAAEHLLHIQNLWGVISSPYVTYSTAVNLGITLKTVSMSYIAFEMKARISNCGRHKTRSVFIYLRSKFPFLSGLQFNQLPSFVLSPIVDFLQCCTSPVFQIIIFFGRVYLV